MSDDMIEVPWHDGTTRSIPSGSLVVVRRRGALRTNTARALAKGFNVLLANDSYYPWDNHVVEEVLKSYDPPKVTHLPTAKGAVIAEFKNGVATGWTIVHDGDGGWCTLGGSRASTDMVERLVNDEYDTDGFTYLVVFDGAGAKAELTPTKVCG